MKFKVGDRIRIISARGLTETFGHAGLIVDYVVTTAARYRIKYTDLFNTQGNNVVYWLYQDDIELDKEYYREQKLEQLL